MIGPRYSRPCLPIQEEWLHAQGGVDECDDPMWWKVFDDATLNSLINAVSNQNKNLKISGIRVYEAYASLGISVGQFFPQFQQLQGSYSSTQLSGNTANVPLALSFKDYFMNFVASWELDLWGKYRHGILASQADLFGSVYNYRDVLRSLIGNLSQVYMQILGYQYKIALMSENVAFQERTVKIVETKFKLGETSALDLQQALSVLAATRATLESQILEKQLALDFLCTLLGFAPFDIESCLPFDGFLPIPPENFSMGIPIDLIRTRPDVRRAEQNAINQVNVVGISQTELLPAFSLSGFFGNQAEKGSHLFRSGSRTYNFSQNINWNIFNYGRLTNNVKLQNAIFQELLVQYQNAVISACLEVEDAMISYAQNRNIVKDLGETVNATSRTLQLSLIQYEYGAVEFLNVLTAQTNLAQQQISLIDAKVAYVNNYIAIQTSLGKGWEFKEEGGLYISLYT